MPDTWDELLDLVKTWNGTDFDQDGRQDWGTCLFIYPGCTTSWHVEQARGGVAVLVMPAMLFIWDVGCMQVLASMTQVGGKQSGFLWDPATLEPFVDSPAMLYALQTVIGLVKWVQLNCQHACMAGCEAGRNAHACRLAHPQLQRTQLTAWLYNL